MTDQDERLCTCGHTAHWHGSQGAGECEHDGECECKTFTAPRLVPKAVADDLADLLQRSLHLSPVVTMNEIEDALARYQEAVDRAA